MSIISVEKYQKEDLINQSDREKEIKEIILTLDIGFSATVKLDCKYTTYRTSFKYFLDKLNEELKPECRKFSFKSTNDKEIFKIVRIC